MNTTLMADNVKFQNYLAQSPLIADFLGGCIFLDQGIAILRGCVFATNSSPIPVQTPHITSYLKRPPYQNARSGGAIYSTAELYATNCMFIGNLTWGWQEKYDYSGPATGGAVHCVGPTVFVGCSFYDNSAIGAGGVSYWNVPNIRGREGKGGAVYSENTLQIVNCTFALNAARGGPGIEPPLNGISPGGDAYGGAIYSAGLADIRFSTFDRNSAVGGVGGDSTNPSGGHREPDGLPFGSAIYASQPTTLFASIFNQDNGSSNCVGLVIDQGYNLSSDSSLVLNHSSSRNNTDPRLGIWGDHGGRTFTVPLLNGSPAIDAGPESDVLSNDQRGVPRPFSRAHDIGAFEQAPTLAISGKVSGLLDTAVAGLVIVFVGSRQTTLRADGSYTIESLFEGTYTVRPASSSYLFLPASREVTGSWPVTNIDFVAYAKWSVLVERGQGWTAYMAIGDPGEKIEFQSSTNLMVWEPISTGTIDARGLYTYTDINTRPIQFFRFKRLARSP
ncbi:MAG TPA: choice-of-anchor Q domain-containing protein [Candidatus Paceibacterota bacterium]|nr:choice-of-anchor Q domain-containing protein [Verrucomicrobiota bacterium]HRY50973.1 choice-of-anchor Q domain-containing protein [Candidatus Paceibacterota bacterium]HSA00239.1 choice-of-anchor Q domain-containing protein [Candidatus Paceibacterota bacterium]